MNKKPDLSLIRKYLNGELDARARYELERQAQDDPMLMDMMQGMEIGDQETDEANLLDIHQMISNRVQNDKEEPLIAVPVSGNGRLKSWKVWSIAASLVLISVVAGLFLIQVPKEEAYTQNQPAVKEKMEIQTDRVGEAKSKPLVNTHKSPIPQALQDTNSVAIRQKNYREQLPAGRKQLHTDETQAIVAIGKAKNSGYRAADQWDAYKNRDSIIENSLDEVVIVGYGTQAKKEVTGAASSVIRIRGMSIIPQAKPDSITQALAGKIAGLEMSEDTPFPEEGLVIKGVVKDKNDHTPLPGVAIKVKGSNIGVSTDSNGKFSLSVPKKNDVLEIRMLGYSAQQIKLNKKNSLAIELSPDMHMLSEVAVGYGRAVKPQKAHPEIGWSAYKKYIKENAIAEKDNGGRVTVAFTVNRQGIPINLRIVSGLTRASNEKAIRLITEGPKWIPNGDGSDQEITLKIKFR